MIMPTFVSVRKNSSSSSIAIKGAGILPFITPTSMIARGSRAIQTRGEWLPRRVGGLRISASPATEAVYAKP